MSQPPLCIWLEWDNLNMDLRGWVCGQRCINRITLDWQFDSLQSSTKLEACYSISGGWSMLGTKGGRYIRSLQSQIGVGSFSQSDPFNASNAWGNGGSLITFRLSMWIHSMVSNCNRMGKGLLVPSLLRSSSFHFWLHRRNGYTSKFTVLFIRGLIGFFYLGVFYTGSLNLRWPYCGIYVSLRQE